MARKRLASEVQALPLQPRRENSKRAKMSPSDDTRSNSSVPSSGSVSVDSALNSSPPTSDHRRQSSMSSMPSLREDDTESSLSSSSEESSDEDLDEEDEEEPIITIGAPKKPQMRKDGVAGSAADIQSRLSAFLPQLAAANKELEEDGNTHSMEDVEEGEQHIEMNLGLGVLEEKGENDSSSAAESSDDESDLSGAGDVPLSSGAFQRETNDEDSNVLAKLMGQRKNKRKGGIEDVG